MNDKELEDQLAELADSYVAEFDVDQGLDRLRAAGHGFRDSGEGSELAPADR